MSKKDGRAVLLHATDKKGFFTLRAAGHEFYDEIEKAANACPVKIISVKEN
jgi:ferredoxin